MRVDVCKFATNGQYTCILNFEKLFTYVYFNCKFSEEFAKYVSGSVWPQLRRISIQLKMSRDRLFAIALSFEIQTFKRNECA